MRQITQKEFSNSIKNKNGNFKNIIFNFPINLTEFESINFELNFKNSIFSEPVNFNKISINKDIDISKCVFLNKVNFFNTTFKKKIIAHKTEFYKYTNFNLSCFMGEADFNKAIFYSQVFFKKTSFNKALFFNKTFFYKKIDLSYAHFSNYYPTSFLSINKKYGVEKKEIIPPSFLFRHVHFPTKTIFTNVNLTRTIFQDSIIKTIEFKDCQFPKIQDRNVFYAEQAKTIELETVSSIDNLSEGRINTIILPNTDKFFDLNISDRLKITNGEKTDIFFIVNRFNAENRKEMNNLLTEINKNKIYTNFKSLICRNWTTPNNQKIVAYQIKKFNEKKHWNVLEDIYRQMKKSLEESHDWQGAGDFYRGEMVAQIKRLRLGKEKPLYRTALSVYEIISCFGSSLKKIFSTMIISLLLGILTLTLFNPILDIFTIIEKNIIFFLPIFGDTFRNLEELNLQSWQNVIILMEITWFYLLWLILAITIRRKFKR